MVRLLRDRYLWFLVALAIIMGTLTYASHVAALIGVVTSEGWELDSYVALHRFLFLLAVAIAAWRFGAKGGLLACFILGQIILSPYFVSLWQPAVWLEIGVVILGISISWLIGSYEKGRKLLKRTVVELGQQTKELIQEITERQQAEELFKSLALSSPVGIYIVQDGKFVYTNPQFQKDSCYSEEELLDIDSLNIIIPEDRDTVRENAISMLKGERATAYEYRVTTKSGDIKWALETVASIQYQGRRATLGNFVDITERKQAEEALQESEEKYSTIVERGNDGIIIIQDGLVKFANSKIVDITGFSLEEVLNKSFVDFVTSEDKGLVTDRYKRRISGEEVPDRYETWILSKDNNKIPAEISATRIEYKGRLADMAIIRDITERKRNEEKLVEAAQEWRTTFDSITDLVSIVDKDLKLVRVNKAFADTFKMKPVKLIGKHCCKLFHGTDGPVPDCPYKMTIETKEPALGEFFTSHLGVHFEVSTSPIFDETGEVVACVHIARDVTERKKMQEKLIITDRLASVGELASGVAHELNNPLTGVIGFSQLLLDRDVADDVRDDVKIIYREAQRTADVVKNLLTFARKHAPVKELVNINSIVDKVLELRAYDQRINNIQVINQLDHNLPEVIADYFQIQQVFLNIVINAEHFMIEAHGRGKLTITTEKVGDIIRASFADDGPGISKENLGHLFDPFFTTKEVGKGTGLGLSICHGIVTEHGGKIYAESKLGEGATFIIELPIGGY